MSDTKPVIYKPPQQPEEEKLTVSPQFDISQPWAVKIPKFLQEKWEQIKDPGVELGTMVVDQNYDPPRITLRLPVNKVDESGKVIKKTAYDTSNLPEAYTVDIPLDAETSKVHVKAKNTFVFTEKERSWGNMDGLSLGKRKRDKAYPTLLGKVGHEATLRPVKNKKYEKILEQRTLADGQSRRPIVRLEDTGISRGRQNQLASGYANSTSRLGRGMVAIQKKQQGEKKARLEQSELTDRLFQLFNSKTYWSFVLLARELEQPDQWLREVLTEIAEQVPSGIYAGLWMLKPEWRELKDDILDQDGAKEEADEEESEDDDNEEMEEVM